MSAIAKFNCIMCARSKLDFSRGPSEELRCARWKDCAGCFLRRIRSNQDSSTANLAHLIVAALAPPAPRTETVARHATNCRGRCIEETHLTGRRRTRVTRVREYGSRRKESADRHFQLRPARGSEECREFPKGGEELTVFRLRAYFSYSMTAHWNHTKWKKVFNGICSPSGVWGKAPFAPPPVSYDF